MTERTRLDRFVVGGVRRAKIVDGKVVDIVPDRPPTEVEQQLFQWFRTLHAERRDSGIFGDAERGDRVSLNETAAKAAELGLHSGEYWRAYNLQKELD
jgi:hypothetical protein